MLEEIEESNDVQARIASASAGTEKAAASMEAEFAAAVTKPEDEEDELPLLPRHTKVVVTGNNRTKSVLVGLQGVVKKAVGLGGWHWLALTNGLEVKLQRNALSVLEPPTGLEEDNDSEDQMSRPNSEDLEKPFRVRTHVQRNGGISRVANRKSRKVIASNPSRFLKVDFSKFEMTSLWRYWRHFELAELGLNPSKQQLVNAVESHFMSLQLDEAQVIASFVQAAKRLKTVCG